MRSGETSQLKQQQQKEDEAQSLGEYQAELDKLDAQGMDPVGINEHLESFIRFVEWKDRTKELFGADDSAKELY